MSELGDKILAALDKGPASAKFLAAEVGTDHHRIHVYLASLAAVGKVIRLTDATLGRYGRSSIYRKLTDDERTAIQLIARGTFKVIGSRTSCRIVADNSIGEGTIQWERRERYFGEDVDAGRTAYHPQKDEQRKRHDRPAVAAGGR